MKLASCSWKGEDHVALVQTDSGNTAVQVILLTALAHWPWRTMLQCIEQAASALPAATNIGNAMNAPWQTASDIIFKTPLPPRRNIICLGWNYAEHARESARSKGIRMDQIPEHPVVFTKATTTANGPFDTVILDETITRRLDWEVELGVIIGAGGRGIAESEALRHVFGYTVINDISARDLQKQHGQFFMGKSLDGSCPMGPWIVTADEITDVQNLGLTCSVNGLIKQNGHTSRQIFPVARIIHILSTVMTLLPGDIIATGTPSGVGFAADPPQFLNPGDKVACEIEHIGRIENTIAAENSQ